MNDPLEDELEGPFHPEKWGALRMCANCDRYSGIFHWCCYHEIKQDPDMLACNEWVPEGTDGD